MDADDIIALSEVGSSAPSAGSGAPRAAPQWPQDWHTIKPEIVAAHVGQYEGHAYHDRGTRPSAPSLLRPRIIEATTLKELYKDTYFELPHYDVYICLVIGCPRRVVSMHRDKAKNIVFANFLSHLRNNHKWEIPGEAAALKEDAAKPAPLVRMLQLSSDQVADALIDFLCARPDCSFRLLASDDMRQLLAAVLRKKPEDIAFPARNTLMAKLRGRFGGKMERVVASMKALCGVPLTPQESAVLGVPSKSPANGNASAADSVAAAEGDADIIDDDLTGDDFGEVDGVGTAWGSDDRPLALWGAATMDGWSTRAMRPFVGITYHLVDEGFQQHSIVLGLRPFPHPHSGDAYYKALARTLKRYGLRTPFVTTDNCSVMEKAFNGKNMLRFPCFAHKTHTMWEHAKRETQLGADMKILTSVVTTLTAGSSRRQYVAELAKALKADYTTFVPPYSKRWHFELYAIERLRKMRKVLAKVNAEDKAFTWARIDLRKAFQKLQQTVVSTILPSWSPVRICVHLSRIPRHVSTLAPRTHLPRSLPPSAAAASVSSHRKLDFHTVII